MKFSIVGFEQKDKMTNTAVRVITRNGVRTLLEAIRNFDLLDDSVTEVYIDGKLHNTVTHLCPECAVVGTYNGIVDAIDTKPVYLQSSWDRCSC